MQPGDRVPPFVVTTADGNRADYQAFWQRRNLLLVVLPAAASAAEADYVAEIARAADDLESFDAVSVITRQPVANLAAPAALVADRWGEIRIVAEATTVAGLPSCRQLLECLQGIAHECPECQGEVK